VSYDFGHKKNQREFYLSFTAQEKTQDKNRTTDKIKKRHELNMNVAKYKEKNQMG